MLRVFQRWKAGLCMNLQEKQNERVEFWSGLLSRPLWGSEGFVTASYDSVLQHWVFA